MAYKSQHYFFFALFPTQKWVLRAKSTRLVMWDACSMHVCEAETAAREALLYMESFRRVEENKQGAVSLVVDLAKAFR